MSRLGSGGDAILWATRRVVVYVAIEHGVARRVSVQRRAPCIRASVNITASPAQTSVNHHWWAVVNRQIGGSIALVAAGQTRKPVPSGTSITTRRRLEIRRAAGPARCCNLYPLRETKCRLKCGSFLSMRSRLGTAFLRECNNNMMSALSARRWNAASPHTAWLISGRWSACCPLREVSQRRGQFATAPYVPDIGQLNHPSEVIWWHDVAQVDKSVVIKEPLLFRREHRRSPLGERGVTTR